MSQIAGCCLRCQEPFEGDVTHAIHVCNAPHATRRLTTGAYNRNGWIYLYSVYIHLQTEPNERNVSSSAHRTHTCEPFYLIISTLVAHSHPISFSLCYLLLSLLSLDARRDSRNTLINLNSVSTCQLYIFRSVGKKLKCSVVAWVRECRCWSGCCCHILHQ